MCEVDTQVFWQQFYESGNLPWDQQLASPSLVDYYETNPAQFPKHGNILVPGCGQGHEAFYFAQQGFNVLGCDWAQGAVDIANKNYQHPNLKFIQADFFELGKNYPNYFDCVIEYTFFVAIPKEQRGFYIEAIKQLLKPQTGLFFGALWLKADVDEEKTGPPHRLTQTEIENYFNTAPFQAITLSKGVYHKRDEMIVLSRLH